jgi:hypothetical protein
VRTVRDVSQEDEARHQWRRTDISPPKRMRKEPV